MSFAQTAIIFVEMLGVIAVVMLMALHPRVQQQPPLEFKYPRREGYFSLGLFAGALILAVFIWNSWGTSSSSSGTNTTEALIHQLIPALVGLLIFGAALTYRQQPLRSAGWSKALLTPAVQLGVAVVLLSIFLRGMFSRLISGVSSEQGTALLMILATCLAEEFIFRGYIQLRLSSWLGKSWGWLAASGLFIVWQIPRLLVSPSDTLLVQLGILTAQSLLAGWMMQKSRHILAPALYRTISLWLSFLV